MNEQEYIVDGNTTVYTAPVPERKVTTREVASLVLGIISIYLVLSGSIPVLGYVFALILSIVGVVMGSRARKEASVSLMSSAGYVCSMIGLVLSAVMLLGIILLAVTAGVAFGEVSSNLPEIINNITSGM